LSTHKNSNHLLMKAFYIENLVNIKAQLPFFPSESRAFTLYRILL